MILLGLGAERSTGSLPISRSNRFSLSLTLRDTIAAANMSMILGGNQQALNTKDQIVNIARKCGSTTTRHS